VAPPGLRGGCPSEGGLPGSRGVRADYRGLQRRTGQWGTGLRGALRRDM